jgi:tRNA A37 methylthiotransferase MiaB
MSKPAINIKPTVKIKTFGCRSNFSDTIDLASRIETNGGVPSDFDHQEHLINS